MKFERSTLANGLTAVTVPLRGRSCAATAVWVRAGVRDETAETNGISHFIEHLVFKGTRRRSMSDIKAAVEGRGGALNAFTAEEMTCYYAKTPPGRLWEALDVLADMAIEPRMDPGDIEKERAVVLEEIKMVKDQPADRVEEILDSLVWSGNALGRPITGTQASMRGITRRHILDYLNRMYAPDRVTVTVAGDVSHGETVRRCSRLFGSRRRSDAPARSASTSGGVPFRHEKMPVEQVHIALGVPGLPKGHPRQYVLSMLNTVLGGNMSSRLFNEVREEMGLCYDISSGTKRFEGTGCLSIQAGLDAGKSEKALREIFRQCRALARRPVGRAELSRAREYLRGQFATGLDGVMDRMLWIGEEIVGEGRVRTAAEIERGLRAVTPSAVRELASALFRDGGLRCALLGPLPAAVRSRLPRLLTFGGR